MLPARTGAVEASMPEGATALDIPSDSDRPLFVHREAAMRRQPFALDGATVTLVREEEARALRAPARADSMALVALRDYPAERNIRYNCCMFGLPREVDPACFAAPDQAAVRVVLEDPWQIPREIWLDYFDGTASVVPVEIVRVWHRDFSFDAHGQYVRLFQQHGQYVRLFQQPPAAAG